MDGVVERPDAHGRRRPTGVTRRAFLQWAAIGAAASGAACASPAPSAPGSAAAPAATAPPPAAPQSQTPPAPAPSTPLGPIEYGIVSTTAGYWPIYVMERKGLLERERLDARLNVTRSPTAGLQALVAADGLHIMGTSTDPAIRAVEQGGDFVFVGGVQMNPAYTLVSSPAITTLAELRGKNVAVNGVRDGPITLIRRLLVRNGLPADSVDFVPVGGTPERYAALKGGAVAATILSQPNDFQAEEEGFRALTSLSDMVPSYLFTAWAVRRSWARDNAEALTRFLRAHAAACRWLFDPANREEAIALLVEATRTEERFARLSYTLYYETLRGQVFSDDGAVTLPGLRGVLDVMADLGEFDGPPPPAEKYVDDSYWRRATAS